MLGAEEPQGFHLDNAAGQDHGFSTMMRREKRWFVPEFSSVTPIDGAPRPLDIIPAGIGCRSGIAPGSPIATPFPQDRTAEWITINIPPGSTLFFNAAHRGHEILPNAPQ